jgi:hypothetical protein
MKLSTLSKEPQLVEILIDDEEIVKEYGEALSFHTWDRQPMHIFVQLANLSQESESKNPNIGQMLDLVKNLILDEDGKEIITDKASLPTHVLIKVIGKVTETLGK